MGGVVATVLAIYLLWPARRPEIASPVRETPVTGLPADFRSALRVGRQISRPGIAAPEGEEERVRAALARDPADIEARLDLARIHLVRREMRAVWEHTRFVLVLSPAHPRALTYAALVRYVAGDKDGAVRILEQVVAAAPDSDEARRALVFVYLRAGREDDAAATATAAR